MRLVSTGVITLPPPLPVPPLPEAPLPEPLPEDGPEVSGVVVPGVSPEPLPASPPETPVPPSPEPPEPLPLPVPELALPDPGPPVHALINKLEASKKLTVISRTRVKCIVSQILKLTRGKNTTTLID